MGFSTNSVIDLSMDLTISGVVNMGPALFSNGVGTVIAYIANIDKSRLGWLDVVALQSKYPGRVATDGSVVSFKGPVAIIQSLATIKLFAGLAAGIVVGVIAYKVLQGRVSQQTHRSCVIAIFAATAFAVYFGFESVIPIRPGVYFY